MKCQLENLTRGNQDLAQAHIIVVIILTPAAFSAQNQDFLHQKHVDSAESHVVLLTNITYGLRVEIFHKHHTSDVLENVTTAMSQKQALIILNFN